MLPADDVILAIGQENAFPWIERDSGIEFDKDGMPVVDAATMQSTRPGVYFGGDSAFGPKNIIWAVAHAHEAAISIHNHCSGVPVTQRPAQGMNLITQKMGLAEWSYSNDYNPAKRAKMKHVDLRERFAKLAIEVELGFDPEQTAREVERCLNCDVQTVFTDAKCIECDACIDVCPTTCLTIAPNGEEDDLRSRLTVVAGNLEQELFVSGALPQTGRVMVKDEDVCVHCGLCAERCPTAAWDMQKFDLRLPYAQNGTGTWQRHRHRQWNSQISEARWKTACVHRARAASPAKSGTSKGSGIEVRTNDFALKLANVNGTGSASANGLLMQAIFRMGIPVSGKNLFPSNIQGLPTWYEVRVNKSRPRVARAGLRPGHRDELRDVRARRQGGPLGWLAALRLELAAGRVAVAPRHHLPGRAAGAMCNDIFKDSRERILMKNIAYLGALVALLDIDMHVIDELLEEKFSKKKALRDSNHKALRAGYDYAKENLDCPLPIRLEKMHATDDRILIDGNTATALGLRLRGRDGGRLVPDHAVDVGDGCVQGVLQHLPEAIRRPARTTSASCRPRTSWRRSAW